MHQQERISRHHPFPFTSLCQSTGVWTGGQHLKEIPNGTVSSTGTCLLSCSAQACLLPWGLELHVQIWAHKFPFSYLADVTQLTPAQARLSPCSGFAQVCSPLLTLITIFSRLRHSMLSCFNFSRVGPELVPDENGQNRVPQYGTKNVSHIPVHYKCRTLYSRETCAVCILKGLVHVYAAPTTVP